MQALRRLVACGALVAAAALAAPGVAAAGVSVGHSGWEWGNPLPQGNTLRAVEFIGPRGYAAGDFGTVLRSDDAGATWQGLATGVTASLVRVRMVNADTIVVGGGCYVRRSDNAGASFRRLPWTPRDASCSSGVASLSFPSGDVGYLLLRNGSVRRTTDGGTKWSVRTALPGATAAGPASAALHEEEASGPHDILFVSDSTGFATIGGQIVRTTDAAGSWTPVQTSAAPVYGLWFVDATTGYAVGGNIVHKTTDGGQTWTANPLTVGTQPLDLRSIRCADASTCIATTAGGAEILRTTDGGATWVPVTPSTERIYAAAFASPTRAVAVGEAGATVVSDDAGQTWARIGGRLPGAAGLRDLSVTSGTLAFAFGSGGALARTTDAGETWASISAPTTEELRDVSFPNMTVGYALDASGTLFRSDNGGESWSILDTGTSAAPRRVVALDDVTVLLIGPKGVRRSTDAGGTFEPVSDKVVRRASLSEADVAAGMVFVYGGKSSAFSINAGRSWRKLPAQPTRRRIAEFDWISRRFGYALDVDGRLYQTRTSGRRWKEITSTGTLTGAGISFGSLTEGYIRVAEFNGETGHLLRTIDAGRTWRPQLLTSDELSDVVSSGAGTDYALSFAGGLFAARGGGAQGADSRLTLKPKRSRTSRGKRNRRRATIQVRGRLRPAEGGEEIVVSARRGTRIRTQTVRAASNGSFTTTWTITGATTFVAQWRGDDDRRGDGSKALVVKPR